VIGPLLSGLLVQHLGFKTTFFAFAALAGLGAAVFTRFVPETKFGETKEPTRIREVAIAAPKCRLKRNDYERKLDLSIYYSRRRAAIVRRSHERTVVSLLGK
jgi:MFS family permease